MRREVRARLERASILRVGVTGHRSHRLHGVARIDLGAVIQRALVALVDADTVQDYSAERWLISGLADGADLLASERALSLGYRLEGFLPFDLAAHLAVFPAPEREILEALLRQSDKTRVEVVSPGINPSDEAACDLAYVQVGRRVLDRSFGLIAIWDGAPARGPGGTGQIVGEARERGLPVLWINLAGEVRLGLGGGPWQYATVQDEDAALLSVWSRAIVWNDRGA